MSFGNGPRIHLAAVKAGTNALTVTLTAEPGWAYRVEATPDWTNWTTVTNFTMTTPQFNFHQPIRSTTKARFYRPFRHAQTTNSTPCGITPCGPNAPGNLLVTANVFGEVLLSWTDNSSDETGFRIERAVAGGTFAPIGTVPANATTFVDTTAQPGTAYLYRLVALNGALPSESSPVVAVTSGPAPLTLFADAQAPSALADGSPAHPFPTVRQANAAASPGGATIVRAQSGAYPGPITITKTLRLVAPGGVVRIGP